MAPSGNLEIIELRKIKPESHPRIEPLQPNTTCQILNDIDLAILDERHNETPPRVKTKVRLINQALLHLSHQTGHQILFSLVIT